MAFSGKMLGDIQDFLDAGGADTAGEILDEVIDAATGKVQEAAQEEVDKKAAEAQQKAMIAFAVLVALILFTRK